MDNAVFVFYITMIRRWFKTIHDDSALLQAVFSRKFCIFWQLQCFRVNFSKILRRNSTTINNFSHFLSTSVILRSILCAYFFIRTVFSLTFFCNCSSLKSSITKIVALMLICLDFLCLQGRFIARRSAVMVMVLCLSGRFFCTGKACASVDFFWTLCNCQCSDRCISYVK